MLNKEQLKVVESIDPFIFLLAGAGSGKTRVIVERIKNLLNQGVDPKEILAITFTRKASHEMRERLKNASVAVHTFHQLAYLRCQEQLHETFIMVDDHMLNRYTQEQILAITNYKNSLFRQKKPKVYEAYQSDLKRCNMLDFDDLLIRLYRAIQRGECHFSYNYIFVDEFQDTNQLQYECLKKMARKNTKILAVGDPDQSIYQFRGASSKIIFQYVKDYQAKIYLLTYNYRSYQSIINAANRMIKRNNRQYKKELKPIHQNKGITCSLKFNNDSEEASWVIENIQYALKKGYSQNHIAILYRNHARAYQLMVQCHENNMAFSIQEEENQDDHHAIKFLTIHQAKGLEFDIVFIIGCEDQLLPSRKINRISSLEEERRLMFVAMTRARYILCFTHISHDAQNHHFTSSPFLFESGVKTSNRQQISDIISLGDENGHQKAHR